MNFLETAELENLLAQLERIHQTEHVAAAEATIRRAVAQQLDAACMLVQRALLLGGALTRANAGTGELDGAPQPTAAALTLVFDAAADRCAPAADIATDDYLFV